MDINVVSDLIIHESIESNNPVSILKLHKLLYYIEAWHMAFFKTPLFEENFQAWVHGPVSRSVYDRFRNRGMFDLLTKDDIKHAHLFNGIDKNTSDHIYNVLNAYMPYSGGQLEFLTHKELPWTEARGDLPPYERCEKEISKQTMQEFYSKRVNA